MIDTSYAGLPCLGMSCATCVGSRHTAYADCFQMSAARALSDLWLVGAYSQLHLSTQACWSPFCGLSCRYCASFLLAFVPCCMSAGSAAKPVPPAQQSPAGSSCRTQRFGAVRAPSRRVTGQAFSGPLTHASHLAARFKLCRCC